MGLPVIGHVNFAKSFRGGERQTLLLIKALSDKGFEQTVVVRKKSELAKKLLDIPNLKIFAISKPFLFSLQSKNVNVWIAHEAKAGHWAFLYHVLHKTPFVLVRRVAFNPKKNWFNLRLYSAAASVVVISEDVRKQISHLALEQSIHLIPDMLTQQSVNLQTAKKLKSRFEGKTVIGHIGALVDSDKGQSLLIQLARYLPVEKRSEYVFLFLGEGKDKQTFLSMTQDLDSVVFEGFVENVYDYLQVMNYFIFPSRTEGLGSILLDAMYQKVPVIASDVGGIPDIVKHEKTGLLVPPNDWYAIAKALDRAEKNKQETTLRVENAYSQSKQFFPDRLVEKYIELVNEITHC